MKARLALAVVLLAGVSLTAQDFISARAGFLNYEEGRSAQAHRTLKDGELFNAAQGRSELLLTPGSFLRLDRSAEIRMLSTRVSDPQVEMVWGLVGLEVAELPKKSHITLAWGDYRDGRAIIVDHTGLYRFRAANDTLRIAVQQGKLRLPGSTVVLKKGQFVELTSTGVSAVAKFNPKDTDLFDLWSSDRAGLLSAASYRAARTTDAGLFRTGVWAFNSYLSMYTYLPHSYYINSPWGYCYYSPRYVISPPSGYGNGGNSGYTPPSQTSTGASAPQPTQMSVPSPPPAHHPTAPASAQKQ